MKCPQISPHFTTFGMEMDQGQVPSMFSINCQRGGDRTKNFRGTHPAEPDETGHSFWECSDGPRESKKPNLERSYLKIRSLDCHLGAYSHLPRLLQKSTVHTQAAKNQAESHTSIRRRVPSFTPSKSSLPSDLPRAYAGPRPTRPEGLPLRSCIKKPPSIIGVQRSSSLRKVSFGHVDLREYRRIAGDNPSVSDGCPLAIGWEYNCRGKVDIDSYEADRVDRKDAAQCGAQGLSPRVREAILMAIAGVSRAEIARARTQAYVHKRLRLQTLDQIGGVQNCQFVGPVERIVMMKESAARKLERAKKGIYSPAQEQIRLWEDAHEAAMQRMSLEEKQPAAVWKSEETRRFTANF